MSATALAPVSRGFEIFANHNPRELMAQGGKAFEKHLKGPVSDFYQDAKRHGGITKLCTDKLKGWGSVAKDVLGGKIRWAAMGLSGAIGIYSIFRAFKDYSEFRERQKTGGGANGQSIVLAGAQAITSAAGGVVSFLSLTNPAVALALPALALAARTVESFANGSSPIIKFFDNGFAGNILENNDFANGNLANGLLKPYDEFRMKIDRAFGFNPLNRYVSQNDNRTIEDIAEGVKPFASPSKLGTSSSSMSFMV